MKDGILRIELLKSFRELTNTDQHRCYDAFINSGLEQKNIENKYMKRTSHIAKLSDRTECFMTFNEYMLRSNYTTLIFSLCGITEYYHYVLYYNIIDVAKLENRAQFICDIMTNLLRNEIPKLRAYAVKFVLCLDNALGNKTLDLFANSKQSAPLYQAFLFMREPSDLQNAQLHDPYTQKAWEQIMHTTINDKNIRELFQQHLDIANSKDNPGLQRFVDDYHTLARDLLTKKKEIRLNFCTMRRTRYFNNILQSHLMDFDDSQINRNFLFDLLRALVIIYGH